MRVLAKYRNHLPKVSGNYLPQMFLRTEQTFILLEKKLRQLSQSTSIVQGPFYCPWDEIQNLSMAYTAHHDLFSSTLTSPPSLQIQNYCMFVLYVLHCAQIFATPWTVAHQAPLSMGFSRQEYWSGSSFPPPGYLPNPEIKSASLMSPAWAGRLFTTAPPGKHYLQRSMF